jgi:centromere DNA-binding complex CBF3 subunit-like protein
VWPEADEWLAKMEAFRPGSSRNRMDLAGPGFLRLVRVLRTVNCRISPLNILLPLFPDHLVWKADVFSNGAYQAFAARVTAASKAAEEPEDLQIKKVLPVLYDRMSMMQADFRQSHAALQRSVSRPRPP